ncbi:MAG: radical SAM protein [Candidatus Lokiarchaeota archaeon]|nr:radical SAM protein [Candidatus Lokiarchaeota archaeon]
MKQLDVLLIHPSTLLDEKKANRTIMSNTLIGYGLLSIGTILKKNGYEVEIWNIPALYYKGLTRDNICAIFKKYDPLVIGIELNWIHFSKGAFEWAKLLRKELPNSKIVLGGVHQNIILKMLQNSSKQLKILSEHIDAFFIGEAEKSFLKYVEMVKNKRDPSKIKGTISFKNNLLHNNGPPEIYEDLDEIPPYDLKIVRPKSSESFNLAIINTCRGPCKYNCIYCIGNNKTYGTTNISPRLELAFHSPKWIIAQIKYILKENKSINLSIQDYIYCNPKKVLQIAQEIQKCPEFNEKIKSFNFAMLPGTINKEVFENLSRASVDNIDFGIESGSENVLNLMRRPYNINVIYDSLKNCVKNGIIAKTYWMVGLPEEKKQDIFLTKKLIKETINLGAIPSWVTPVCIFPTLEMYENAEKYGIKPRFLSFQEYFIFSETLRNRSNFYPDVITHSTRFMDYKEIMETSNEIKRYILEQKEVILENQLKNLSTYVDHHPEYVLNYLESKINSLIGNISETFF